MYKKVRHIKIGFSFVIISEHPIEYPCSGQCASILSGAYCQSVTTDCPAQMNQRESNGSDGLWKSVIRKKEDEMKNPQVDLALAGMRRKESKDNGLS